LKIQFPTNNRSSRRESPPPRQLSSYIQRPPADARVAAMPALALGEQQTLADGSQEARRVARRDHSADADEERRLDRGRGRGPKRQGEEEGREAAEKELE
jgi:hypothetical protein